jgi:hypothetical protein
VPRSPHHSLECTIYSRNASNATRRGRGKVAKRRAYVAEVSWQSGKEPVRGAEQRPLVDEQCNRSTRCNGVQQMWEFVGRGGGGDVTAFPWFFVSQNIHDAAGDRQVQRLHEEQIQRVRVENVNVPRAEHEKVQLLRL